jgi:hypothetical protein
MFETRHLKQFETLVSSPLRPVRACICVLSRPRGKCMSLRRTKCLGTSAMDPRPSVERPTEEKPVHRA